MLFDEAILMLFAVPCAVVAVFALLVRMTAGSKIDEDDKDRQWWQAIK